MHFFHCVFFIQNATWRITYPINDYALHNALSFMSQQKWTGFFGHSKKSLFYYLPKTQKLHHDLYLPYLQK